MPACVSSVTTKPYVDQLHDTLIALSVDEMDQRMTFKSIHTIPDSSILSPEVNITLLSLGTKFIPATKPGSFSTTNTEAIVKLCASRKLTIPNFTVALNPIQRKALKLSLLSRVTTVIPRRDNLTPSQRDTLARLRSDPTLVIRNADKNLGLTIMSKAWYDQQTLAHLNDATTYRPTTSWRTQAAQLTARLKRLDKMHPHTSHQRHANARHMTIHHTNVTPTSRQCTPHHHTSHQRHATSPHVTPMQAT